MSPTPNAVFLSYASQDADAARKICDALRVAGVEVWFDQSELRGGDAWDQKIRRQIKECALFIPIVSANTQARSEGYFRLEWKLADDRTHLKARGAPFLLPVCIDDTKDWDAIVPESFMVVQWVRLPSGETSPAFCERVRTLLSPERPMETGRPRPVERGEGAASPARQRHRKGWLVPLIVGLAIVAGLAVWQPWRTLSPRPKSPTPGAALSEARQLAAKADALFDQDENSPRENLALAEKFCQQAIALDSNDPEIWAIYSRVGSNCIFLTLDRSQERRAQAEDAAARAVKLAPDSYEARYALAYFYRLNDATYPEAERILRQLLTERPQDKRVWRTLGNTLRYTTIFSGKTRGRDPEAVECFRRAASLPGGDPLSLHFLGTLLGALGRLDEGEKALDEALILKPRSLTRVNRTNLMLRYRADVPRAVEALGEVPVEHLREDYGAFIAAQVWLCARQPDKAIAGLQMLPRDYLEAVFDGPKGALIGQAHQMAGRAQAAQIEWRAALQFVDRRLTTQSNNVRLLVWRAWLLACLGDHAEAARVLDTAEQLGLSARDAHTAAAIPLAAGNPVRAIALLALALKEPVVTTAAFARINPAWDALRGDPRFEALVAPAKDEKNRNEKSIAVLPFENQSGDRDNEFFSDGVSDELLNVLGKVPGLRVAGRASAFRFKGTNTPEREIAQQLGVAYVVTGTVQRTDTHVRITARLANASDGFQLWGESFTEGRKDIFALQDKIAGLIAEKLQLKLELGAPRVNKPVNPQAHQLVLEGRYFCNLRDPESLAKAQVAFSKALDIVPDFPPAHAALAEVFLVRSTYAIQDGASAQDLEEDIRRGEREARRAIELDPLAPDGYPELGYLMLLKGRYADAEEQFQKGLALNPNHSASHAWRSILLLSQGQLALAQREMEKSVEIDPFWAANVTTSGEILLYCQRFEDALLVTNRVQSLRPGYVPDLGTRVRAQFAVGRKAEAVETARLVRSQFGQHPRRDADSAAIWVLRQAGLSAESEQYAQEYLKTLPAESQQRGFVLGALGRFDEALPYLERMPPVPRRRLYWDAIWDPWRNDPRFDRLMEKLGCAAEYKAARETLAQILKEQPAKK